MAVNNTFSKLKSSLDRGITTISVKTSSSLEKAKVNTHIEFLAPIIMQEFSSKNAEYIACLFSDQMELIVFNNYRHRSSCSLRLRICLPFWVFPDLQGCWDYEK